MLLRLLGNAYVRQKIDHKLFLLVPATQKVSTGFYITPKMEGITYFSTFFQKSVFPQQKRLGYVNNNQIYVKV